jgi:hypothetical protein
MSSNVKIDKEINVKGDYIYYYIHYIFENKQNLGLHLSIIDSKREIPQPLAYELCKYVFLANTDNINFFTQYVYSEDSPKSIENLLHEHNIELNNIYLIKAVKK